MKTLRIDGESDGISDGRWIMDLVHGSFDPRYDHSICALRDNQRVGGIVFCNWLGASIGLHMAGTDTRWCSRDLLWMAFDYAFNQLGVRKVLGTVASTNQLALSQDIRAGWRIEAVIRDAYPDGDMVILSMQREHCPWLKLQPQGYKSGQE